MKHIFITVIILLGLGATQIFSQTQEPTPENEGIDVPKNIAVKPHARDADIKRRIANILNATGWYENTTVKVNEGLVVLTGQTKNEDKLDWATKLAQNTEDVVGVINNISVVTPDLLDFSPVKLELMKIASQIKQELPLILIAVFLFFITWVFVIGTKKFSTSVLRGKVESPLLRDVLVKLAVLPVMIFGLYFFLRIAGLTSLAITLLGGTGLLGLVLGFALKDIAENFLASVFISAQKPFAKGDLIRIGANEGYVQSVNMRATLLMTLDGNHVQIPNATVYKEIIINQTANPNVRLSFNIGIGYDDQISVAQSIALKVICDHQATLNDPEPLVLVDSLGSSTVNLQAHFWIDMTKYSQFKVRSALIRLTKVAFEQNHISMPDEAREIIFPKGVPVITQAPAPTVVDKDKPSGQKKISEQQNIAAEGGLEADSRDLEAQARLSRTLESGPNLLNEPSS
jgi:small-conductance mechanosensitive channel